MKKIIILAVAILTLLPVAAFAAPGGLVSGPSPKSTTSLVTVIIPSVVGIDIESDITFDFATYTGGTNCVANQWPPQFCGAGTSTVYDGATVGAGSGNPPQSSAIWMAVFSSDNSASTKISARAGSWNAGSPGFATTYITSEAGLAPNNPLAIGPATATFFDLADQLVSTVGNTFPWTRADQVIKLKVPNNAGFNGGTYTTNLTYTISK